VPVSQVNNVLEALTIDISCIRESPLRGACPVPSRFNYVKNIARDIAVTNTDLSVIISVQPLLHIRRMLNSTR
jgi:hypothetical protein